MALHIGEFVVGQLCRLVQNGIDDSDFSHVVKRRGEFEQFAPGRRKAHLPGNDAGIESNALNVLARFVVAIIGRSSQAVNHFHARDRQLFGSLANDLFKLLVLEPQILLVVPGGDRVAHPRDQVGRIDRLREKVAHAEIKRLHPDFAIFTGRQNQHRHMGEDLINGDLSHQIQAADAGHHEVEDNDVGAFRPQKREGREGIARGRDVGKSVVDQIFADDFAVDAFVVDHADFRVARTR